MFKIKHYLVLPALITIGLAFPSGVSKIFLLCTLVSSVFDENKVLIPIISLQSLLLLFYCLWYSRLIRINYLQAIISIMLLLFTLACSYFSLYPGGFLSYSTTWLIAPFAVAIHFKLLKNDAVMAFPATMSMVAYMFLPFYIFDLLISMYAFGLDDFASYTLATNGHTFVSMLFVLFIQLDMIARLEKFRILSYQAFSLLVYITGGFVSQGRVAMVLMLISIMALHWRQAAKILPIGILSLACLIYLNEKIRIVYEALLSADFQDPVVWSSLISRLNFWDVFFDIFINNPFAGAGGLSANIVKYDYGFPYSVFVDPHNEYIFILSGFGICGYLFIITAIILSRSLRRQQLRLSGDCGIPLPQASTYVSLCFVVGCSLTNANSAKQNIELLLCLTILFAVTGVLKSQNYRVKTHAI